MKTGMITTKTIASDDIKDNKSVMGMSVKGMEMAQYFLRDKIYSNKILAVVREYISNAYDEHIKHKIDKNVDIKLYSNGDNDWCWSVRDHAKGLNEYDIRNIFGVYFESTKSNENDSAGGFGIGGKSGFSYSDTFYVTSHHEGLKSSYVCTLGSGTKGIPVGELYKISEEPTNEQGIEITISVKPSDLSNFSKTTERFVKYYSPSAMLMFTNDYGNSVAPITPNESRFLGGYMFNSYSENPLGEYPHQTSKYCIRMGGVIYPYSHSSTHQLLFTNYIVVDVPIGMLSIPISRESIENTPLNDKIFQDIDNYLIQMSQEELSHISTPKFGSVISGNENFSKTYSGTWFDHNYNTIFPKTRKWYYKAGTIYNDPEPTSRKVSTNTLYYKVFIFPNIKSIRNWHKRLIYSLKLISGSDYSGYIFMTLNDYNDMLKDLDSTIDVSDCVFIEVKTLKLPKLDKEPVDNTTYLVHTGYGNKSTYTAEGFDLEIRNTYFKGADLEDDWYLDCDDIVTLNRRTIALVKDYGTRGNIATVGSVKMLNALKDLGWLTPDCDEYKILCSKFREEDRIHRNIENAKSTLSTIYFGSKVPDKIKNSIAKKPDNIQRFSRVKAAILGEDSTRSRILRSLSSYDRQLNREDLRKVLMMKD